MGLLLVAPSGSRRPGTPQPSSAWHLGRCGTCPSVGRTGVRWAGARAEAGGRAPQGTSRAHADGPPQQRVRPSTILPPGPSPVHKSDTSPRGRPGTGHRARSNASGRTRTRPLSSAQSTQSEKPRQSSYAALEDVESDQVRCPVQVGLLLTGCSCALSSMSLFCPTRSRGAVARRP